MALHYGYGGAPEGPVGTGKTETTKDLAKCLAKHCFVFNCSSTLNYSAMTKFFKGLATSGAWSCFDEFNRISLIVLSVISQIIIVIQGAIRENISEFLLEETKINFDRECAIFITMNPTYSGRTELPDNLKSLFRTVAIIVPDSLLISEILLYSYGFFEAKSLAQKLIYTFHLAKQQLSQQVHYDFGLRAIKIVLSSAGILKLITSGIVELGTKLTDDFKPQNESADKTQGQADGKDEGEDVLDQPDTKQSKRKSRQFKLKSKMSTKNFKVFKEGRSLKRKETKRHAKEADDAAPKPDNREEQKGIHEQESSLSSKDILNKDNLSVSSLDSEDIIYNDQDLNEDQLNFKETVTQAYKGKGKLIPVKETEASFAIKLNYISDK
uniref:Dynein heavy chain hydrolytic ATP-binding dynein motor region domain-containing protein n=1 Tax=Euplotes harpa TaxID=151035 RepID=A0A7S3J1R7_9SPIT|mmetsp:Transcript_1489/g.1738  ORF Transcript_1489/g.1738 Transcript_1489/m.1738 type:complete len:382 (+) Transcript_1489:761-1906(+)